MVILKVEFWNSRRFLVNIFIKYRDYKVQQRRITKCYRFKGYKVQQSCIANYNMVWITKCDKNFRNWITQCDGVDRNCDAIEIAMGLQSATDYKVI